MKWVLLLTWIVLCPVVAALLKQSPRNFRWAGFAMGFMPFMLGPWHLYVAPISNAGWAGGIKGVEVSALDFLALAVILTTSARTSPTTRVWPWLMYFATVAIALPQAAFITPAFFYAWQLLRMIMLFVAAIRLTAYAAAIDYALYGLFAGIAWNSVSAVMQKLQGAAQAGGEIGAQNLLGLVAHFTLFPALALILAGRRGWWPWIGLVAAVTVDLLTASRATLGFAAIGAAMLLILSSAKNFTSRKGMIIAAGALAAAVLTPIALKSISARQEGNTVESSNSERTAFKNAAWMIINDHPFGIGPNHYVLIANTGGYNARAGVNWSGGSRSTSVHNSYLLVWAETGLLGLLAMVTLLVIPAFTALRSAMRHKHDRNSELLLGMGTAIVVVSLHFLYEWSFVLFLVQYQFALIAGLAVGIAAALKRNIKPRFASRRASAPMFQNAPASPQQV